MTTVDLLDGLLEATVVGSFSRIGPVVRRRLYDWEVPAADLSGREAVVTGSSSGIGREIATRLAALGAHVWVTSRSEDRAEEAAAQVAQDSGGTTTGVAVDVGELDQVRAFADRLRTATDSVDLLVHNAGALTEDRRETSQGMEATLAAHLVGPYLLTRLLADHLAADARVLFMSSGGMYTQPLVVSRLEMDEDDYRGAVAYARAKRGQVVLAEQLAREWGPTPVVHAMHPGWAATPGVTAGLPVFDRVMGPILRPAAEAADTMVWLATADEAARTSGEFWHDRRRRGTAYLPRTSTTDRQRRRLVPWLDARIAQAETHADTQAEAHAETDQA
ncbi:SDR family NAD(P)-dependent oxidoreductase [Salsipaludibacter albus]|uniref:SDR family NAD(P)-dependent oxidoreductase n=1 Tax=Salsipaludibacter albus TaxID=2849650 RepID=UPI001EE4BBD2